MTSQLDTPLSTRTLWLWPAVAAILISALGVALGHQSFRTPERTAPEDVFALAGPAWQQLLTIGIHNLAAALLLFSGYITCGLTTVVGLMLISTYIGAGWRALSEAAGGSANVVGLVAMYAPWEMLGLLLAAAAGLLPVSVMLRRQLMPAPRSRSRSTPQPALAIPALALRLILLSVALIAVGATAETIVIATHAS